jgi:hypothetical protein
VPIATEPHCSKKALLFDYLVREQLLGSLQAERLAIGVVGTSRASALTTGVV